MAVTTFASAMSGVPFTLQNSATTGSGTILALPSSFRNHTFIITGNAGISAGSVQLETSFNAADANLWAPLAAAVTPLAGDDLLVTVTGIFAFIQARIATTISGGTTAGVTVQYLGAKSF